MEKEKFMSYAEYYESMIDTYTQQRDEARSILNNLYYEVEELFNKVRGYMDIYNKVHNFNGFDYSELFKNEYEDGKFLTAAKRLYYSTKDGIHPELFDLYQLALKQKEISTLEKDIIFCNKILKLTKEEFKKILKTFYFEVHKRLIVNGEGYVFEDKLGWICINRCTKKEDDDSKALDFKKSREKKQQLLAEGKKIWNAKEAAWCKERGIPYEAEDYRVWQTIDSFYEVPLLNCRLPNGTYFKLTLANSLNGIYKGKSMDDICKMFNSLDEIVDADIALRHKINIATRFDNKLYLNFIRNENQQSVKFEAHHR